MQPARAGLVVRSARARELERECRFGWFGSWLSRCCGLLAKWSAGGGLRVQPRQREGCCVTCCC
jgi:hypothetical protein